MKVECNNCPYEADIDEEDDTAHCPQCGGVLKEVEQDEPSTEPERNP